MAFNPAHPGGGMHNSVAAISADEATNDDSVTASEDVNMEVLADNPENDRHHQLSSVSRPGNPIANETTCNTTNTPIPTGRNLYPQLHTEFPITRDQQDQQNRQQQSSEFSSRESPLNKVTYSKSSPPETAPKFETRSRVHEGGASGSNVDNPTGSTVVSSQLQTNLCNNQMPATTLATHPTARPNQMVPQQMPTANMYPHSPMPPLSGSLIPPQVFNPHFDSKSGAVEKN
jgi:hypothetical protein